MMVTSISPHLHLIEFSFFSFPFHTSYEYYSCVDIVNSSSCVLFSFYLECSMYTQVNGLVNNMQSFNFPNNTLASYAAGI